MQMLLTVALLQLSAKLLPSVLKVEPLTMQLMKDILPLTLVGLAGLVFNTLCLRSVDTTFFQVSRTGLPLTDAALMLPRSFSTDCTRNGPSKYYWRFGHLREESTSAKRRRRSGHRDGWLHDRRLPFRVPFLQFQIDGRDTRHCQYWPRLRCHVFSPRCRPRRHAEASSGETPLDCAGGICEQRHVRYSASTVDRFQWRATCDKESCTR